MGTTISEPFAIFDPLFTPAVMGATTRVRHGEQIGREQSHQLSVKPSSESVVEGLAQHQRPQSPAHQRRHTVLAVFVWCGLHAVPGAGEVDETELWNVLEIESTVDSTCDEICQPLAEDADTLFRHDRTGVVRDEPPQQPVDHIVDRRRRTISVEVACRPELVVERPASKLAAETVEDELRHSRRRCGFQVEVLHLVQPDRSGRGYAQSPGDQTGPSIYRRGDVDRQHAVPETQKSGDPFPELHVLGQRVTWDVLERYCQRVDIEAGALECRADKARVVTTTQLNRHWT